MKNALLIGLLSLALWSNCHTSNTADSPGSGSSDSAKAAVQSTASNNTELEKKNFLDGKVTLLVPKQFFPMPEEILRIKYPSDRRPAIVYTDSTTGINLALNPIDNPTSQHSIEPMQTQMVQMFKNMYPSATWSDQGVKVINGKKVAYFDFVTPAMDQKVHNLIFFSDCDGKLLLCTFNCVEKKYPQWQSVAYKMLNSFVVNE